jgi:hypothetical protein
MHTPPEAITRVLRAAQRSLNHGDAQAALDRLEALPPASRTAPVMRLQGLCLLLLDRPQQAHDLAVAAQARHPAYPFALLQAADLAWHRRDHWPALLVSLEAVQQQPRLHNLWLRISKITTALGAAPTPAVTTTSHHDQLRTLLLALVDQLLAQPSDQRLLERLAQLLPLLPADADQSLLADHCRHALMALQAFDTLV